MYLLKGRNDTLLHLFWQCKVTSLFWGTFFQWLQSCSFIQQRNHLVISTALGLKPDSSNTKLQIYFFSLVSRYYIWTCKLRDEIPNLLQFLRLLKKLTKSKQMSLTSSLKNGSLSLATFKGLRVRKLQNSNRVTLAILPTKGPTYACLRVSASKDQAKLEIDQKNQNFETLSE